MARTPGKTATYRAAELFRDNCLKGRSSLLWPNERPWTLRNLQALRAAIVEHFDESPRSFLEKLRDQLAPESEDVSRVAVDIMGFFYLFPITIGEDTKLNRLKQIVEWKEIEQGLDLRPVELAYSEGGIGKTGQYYNTGIFWLFTFLIQLGVAALESNIDFSDMHALERLADKAEKGIAKSTRMVRNVALHLLLPDSFERTASDGHKKQILETFDSYDPGTGSIDERLLQVREGVAGELARPAFDYYDEDVVSRWNPEQERADDSDSIEASPRIWIEKTIVKGRADRNSGEHAVGRALWSPRRAKNGSDMYKFMREIRPGDIVLHLTDNRAFTGRSIVASGVDDGFQGLEGTDWTGPAYRVQLRDYQDLVPPLDREVFFAEPFKSQLRRLAADGVKYLFFNSEPSLNQGAYLTPAPPRLVDILSAAYRTATGRELLDPHSTVVPPAPARVFSSEEPSRVNEIRAAFSNALRTCGITFGSRHDALVRSFVASLATKRFVIITGLSGSGKTQLALRFGQWLGADKYLTVAVRPDWTGSDAMFGFPDALQKTEQGRHSWRVPDALKFMLRAASDPHSPYLLVLDEMNLAHVERYFADVLSGIESDQPVLPNLTFGTDSHWREVIDARPQIPVPRNLFIVGTVNVDETTYMFSPKVLDRANTFEFRVETSELVLDARRPVNCEAGPSELVASFAAIAANPEWHNEHPSPQRDIFAAQFKKLHSFLTRSGFEYGHRTFTEALRFAALLSAAGDSDANDALDLQIMQKLLPRLHGARRRMEPVLRGLSLFCFEPDEFNSDNDSVHQAFDPVAVSSNSPKLPISFNKIARMTKTLRANQFVSFTE